jgi:hypothetical protein
MSRLALKAIQAAAGNAGEAVYVDDVFSTYLYDGATTSRTIDNGIDLAGEGGMVWLKQRSGTRSPAIFDTERGDDILYTDGTGAQSDGYVSSFGAFTFSSTGFSTGTAPVMNENGYTHASWTVRKQPGFFDIVTYTGTGNAGTPQTINHNLDSAPALIIVKKTSASQDWLVFSKDTSQPHNKYLKLNSNVAEQNYDNIWGPNGYLPTTTEFKVDHIANESGATYVAYLFANNDQRFGTNSDESIIKCGSYTGNGSTTGPVIDLGFEPQWVMIKSTGTNPWMLFDSMRGIVTDNTDLYLMANDASSENAYQFLNLTPTGFQLNSTGAYVNSSSQDYIYVAIRRPHKPASEFAANDLFDIYNNSSSTTEPVFRTSPAFPVDYAWFRDAPSGTDSIKQAARLTATKYLDSTSTAAEATLSTAVFDYMNGWRSTGGANQYSWMFRRAPGFFDVVTYTGNGSAGRDINHNLGVAPELMIIKQRSAARSWAVYNSSSGTGKFLKLEDAAGEVTQSGVFDTAPTESVFTVETNTYVNISGGTYIAYLFATVAGISKVGSYSGSGSDVDVDCGFTSGARFVIIKKTNATGHWYLWDSARGITAGADPHLKLNSDAAQQTGSAIDINPYSSGFSVPSGDAAVNTSGNTYIFLAIA